MGCSDSLISILNFITMVLSFPIVAAGVWLSSQSSSECYKFLQWPVIVLGLFIFVLSLSGFCGSCCQLRFLLCLYLIVMFLLILLLFIFTVFAFAVTHKGAGELVSNKGYKEYRLGEYSSWLQRQVGDASNWNKVQSCLSHSKTCALLNDEYISQFFFDRASLTPVQSGCCKPPTGCECKFINATLWTQCSNMGYIKDCRKYEAAPDILCYSCDSCKAGVIQEIKDDWHTVAIINIVTLFFLTVVYSVGCCAFRNVKRSEGYSHYGKS